MKVVRAQTLLSKKQKQIKTNSNNQRKRNQGILQKRAVQLEIPNSYLFVCTQEAFSAIGNIVNLKLLQGV